MEDWQEQALREVRASVENENPLSQLQVELVEFVSRSNGRGRSKRRKWREVMFVRYRGRTFSIGTRLTRKLEFLMKDVYPEELARNTGYDWLTSFVQELRKISRHK